ncbi:hypothetical protein ACFQ5N_02240 [Lutibacter holmesii]|uniref:Phage protein n=1 Tax=Lutibacter holmesii TaxID=1137985 RepID=A0ABW3WK33_9FLAO
MKIELTKEQISLVNNMINVELHYSQETVYDKGELKRLKKAFDMPVVSRSKRKSTLELFMQLMEEFKEACSEEDNGIYDPIEEFANYIVDKYEIIEK